MEDNENRETLPWALGWGGMGWPRRVAEEGGIPAPQQSPGSLGSLPPLPFPPTAFQALHPRTSHRGEDTHTHTGVSKSTHSNTGCREICHLFTCEQTHGHLWQCLLATAREAHMCKASHAVNTDTNAPVCIENCSARPWLGYIYSDIQLRAFCLYMHMDVSCALAETDNVHTLGLLSSGHAHIHIRIPQIQAPHPGSIPTLPRPSHLPESIPSIRLQKQVSQQPRRGQVSVCPSPCAHPWGPDGPAPHTLHNTQDVHMSTVWDCTQIGKQ